MKTKSGLRRCTTRSKSRFEFVGPVCSTGKISTRKRSSRMAFNSPVGSIAELPAPSKRARSKGEVGCDINEKVFDLAKVGSARFLCARTAHRQLCGRRRGSRKLLAIGGTRKLSKNAGPKRWSKERARTSEAFLKNSASVGAGKDNPECRRSQQINLSLNN